VFACTRECAWLYVCVVRVNVCMCACERVHVCGECGCAHVQVCLHACVSVHVWIVRVNVCVCACESVHVCVKICACV